LKPLVGPSPTPQVDPSLTPQVRPSATPQVRPSLTLRGGEVRVFLDPEVVAVAAADLFVSFAAEAVRERGSFGVALSGGSTPASLFRELRSPGRVAALDWSAVHLFWGDERCVPPDHPESNFGMAKRELLAHVPVPPDQVHRIRGEDEPWKAARAYEEDLRSFVGGRERGRGGLDLVFLGIGADGHTASLFPGTPALEAGGVRVAGRRRREGSRGRELREGEGKPEPSERWVLETRGPRPGSWRVTLTLPAINGAEVVAFLATGAGKAGILQRVFTGGGGGEPLYPAQRVRPRSGRLLWLVDEAAASELPQG
jgi:6-phosphogluconolactonase